MRLVERHPVSRLPKIERTTERDGLLESFVSMEIEDALTARRGVDKVVNEARRQYNGIPKRPIREVPVPNAPNIEVTLGAILADDIYAQATDTLFTASPLLICRPVQAFWVEHAKAAQDWVNWMALNELNLRNAANNAIADDCQLGTGAYYIPFVEQTKKDKVYRVTYRSPTIMAIPYEDIILPPSARSDVQKERWVGVRFWYTHGELEERARKHKWNIEKAQAVAQYDLVRLQHERKANLRGTQMWREVYEIIELYAYFDYDGDGIEEDLLITWDRASRSLLNVTFNPYDTRPIEVMRYQLRPHLPYGIGVMEMTQPYQEEMTEMHNATLLNAFLANARVWTVKEGALMSDTMEVSPGRVVKLMTDDVRSAIAQLPMSDVYPSAMAIQQMVQGLAERRVGTSGAAGMLAKGGSRTPGVTALSLLQQVNRRFAPAFDDMRETTAAAVRQAIWRYRERILSGDKQVEDHIVNIMGEERGALIHELLRADDVTKCIAVEFTAASASINREADRQNAMLLNQMMAGYYQQTTGMIMQAVQSGAVPALQEVLIDVAKKGTELMDRTLRTFDQVRDPQALLLDMNKVTQGVVQGTQQMLMQQVMQSLMTPQGAGNGAMPAAEGGEVPVADMGGEEPDMGGGEDPMGGGGMPQ